MANEKEDEMMGLENDHPQWNTVTPKQSSSDMELQEFHFEDDSERQESYFKESLSDRSNSYKDI